MTRPATTAALLSGAIFGIGLAVSQMTNPEKVLGFLTWLPGWDPSLVLVMGGGVIVTWLGYRYALTRKPLFAESNSVPTSREITGRLLGGAAIFGIGWGIAGYCPGPAIAGLLGGSLEPVIFVAAVIAGSEIARRTAA